MRFDWRSGSFCQYNVKRYVPRLHEDYPIETHSGHMPPSRYAMGTTLRCLIWLAPRPGQNFLFFAMVCLFIGAARIHAQDDRPPNSAARDLPQYRLKVGQQLHYQRLADENLLPSSVDEEKKHSRYESHTHWWIWVTRQNDNGGWRLLIRKQLKNVAIHPEAVPSVYFQNDFLGYCDLQLDGSFEANPTIGGHQNYKTHPDEVFVHLPPSVNALRDGWKYTLPFEDAQYALGAVT
jgi:hypothetical protein